MHIHCLTTSHAPVFLVNSRLGLVFATPSGFGRKGLHPTEAPLLPKLRGQLAEFLNQSSSARLRILYAPTCVGLRYGQPDHSLEVFLGSMASGTSPNLRFGVAPQDCPGGFAYQDSLHAYPRTTIAWDPLSSCVSPSVTLPLQSGRYHPTLDPRSGALRDAAGTGISTRCPSATPFGLALGPD